MRLLARLRPVPSVVGVFAVASTRAFAQCAMCKEALESGDPAAGRLARSMGWTIFLLLGMLLATTGGAVFLILKHGKTRPVPPPGAEDR